MKHIKVLGHGLALFAVVLIQIPAALIALVGVVLSFILGMVFLFPPSIRLIRSVARLDRRLILRWTGIKIEEPYHPPPPPPVRQRDGWYRDGRTLYRKPTMPAFNARLNWFLRDPSTWREIVWLLIDPWTRAVLAAGPTLLIGYGVYQTWQGNLWGLALPVAAIVVAPWALRIYGFYAMGMLGPTASTQLIGQVRHLNQVRVEAVDAQAAELRRIERDLHDGAQARMVAVGMTIGAAEQLIASDPEAAKALLAKARESSATALAELRQLVRGIHPPVLAERGLGDAIRALALDSPLKVEVSVDLDERPESPVESAVYFAVAELLANASRHATKVSIDISRRGRALRVTVADDGSGGAVIHPGGGLSGIERRLATFDGVLALTSPPGGPTVATLELPFALSAQEPEIRSAGWRGALVAICWTLCWIPLIPQGIVTGFMLAFGAPTKSWFLALYMPEPLQWPTVFAMITLGATMLAGGIVLSASVAREEAIDC
ncbi:sensor domain-containing protein [Acrocarpospora macrocephala]|uniref:histidine kinase n=1 Tax=Acrocarpospora macrocephala TaxID=150177 RepID=A0A5M3WHY9_9ACTN|nr:histidine kinase [Acrocarpospora macrocephala]GES07839.1 histidine kinase [Acrocarpospora macrocephala]